MDSGYGFRGMTKVCPVCGKKFWCEDPKAWVYRVLPGGQVCTYSCLMKHRKDQERREEEYREAKINPDTLCFIGNLGRLISEKQVNGAELGRQIGKTKATVYGYMNREIRCRYATVLKIAEVLGVEPQELITQE